MPGCINDSRSKFPISKVGAALLILLLQKGIIGKTNNIACETYAILPVFCICPFQKHIYICDLQNQSNFLTAKTNNCGLREQRKQRQEIRE